jgi:hypothetical protein
MLPTTMSLGGDALVAAMLAAQGQQLQRLHTANAAALQALPVPAKARLAKGLHLARGSPLGHTEASVVANVLLSTRGAALTQLKNALDATEALPDDAPVHTGFAGVPASVAGTAWGDPAAAAAAAAAEQAAADGIDGGGGIAGIGAALGRALSQAVDPRGGVSGDSGAAASPAPSASASSAAAASRRAASAAAGVASPASEGGWWRPGSGTPASAAPALPAGDEGGNSDAAGPTHVHDLLHLMAALPLPVRAHVLHHTREEAAAAVATWAGVTATAGNHGAAADRRRSAAGAGGAEPGSLLRADDHSSAPATPRPAATGAPWYPAKVYCDYDDTVQVRLLDHSYATGCVYPGLLPLIAALRLHSCHQPPKPMPPPVAHALAHGNSDKARAQHTAASGDEPGAVVARLSFPVTPQPVVSAASSERGAAGAGAELAQEAPTFPAPAAASVGAGHAASVSNVADAAANPLATPGRPPAHAAGASATSIASAPESPATGAPLLVSAQSPQPKGGDAGPAFVGSAAGKSSGGGGGVARARSTSRGPPNGAGPAAMRSPALAANAPAAALGRTPDHVVICNDIALGASACAPTATPAAAPVAAPPAGNVSAGSASARRPSAAPAPTGASSSPSSVGAGTALSPTVTPLTGMPGSVTRRAAAGV